MKKHILIVEDEPDIARALAARLNNEGYACSIADNGLDGLELASSEMYDLVILDIMLPGIDGLEVAKELKAKKNTAILFLSARGEESEIVTGLDLGGDDYVTKPFSQREVVARVNALLRRTSRTENRNVDHMVEFGELRIDPISRKISLSGNSIHATPTEFRLLSMLCSQPGTVFTREQLVELLSHSDGNSKNENELLSPSHLRTVDSHVRSLRKKIGSHFIRTIHAIGYAFEPDAQEDRESA